ncbi:MAG: hypothetical protein HN576_05365 [Bacteriovoracaceae bacterium]|jgi:hypothetical protein|nr:hypothetical protein [Bacteriovoracaceae bacterium]
MAAKCKFCGNEIFWMKDGRKNVPHELDGGKHSCEEMQKAIKSTVSMSPSSLSPEEIAKYEAQINAAANKAKKQSVE